MKHSSSAAIRQLHGQTTMASVPVPPAVQSESGATDNLDNATGHSLAEHWKLYQIDRWQRAILFLDTLRERADNMQAHEVAGMPPLLDFEYETLLDARTFERPANYALLRIARCHDYHAADCVDPAKPPVIIVDPRAGHGPGIGGFKRDSEVGVALHSGHATYFVMFFPLPCPNQSLGDVLAALRRFVAEVAARHPGTPPVLYGNCQAGWAVTLLAADCEGLTGPTVLNGSPLSYWAGKSDVNPIVIFASSADNITPPHQALNWIPTVYPTTDALKEAGQRIVYLLNTHVGHLGIFVSADVARLEHRAILEHLDALDALAPGLYEMKIDNPTGNADCRKDQYKVHFEERQVEQIEYAYPAASFEKVQALSEWNEQLYSNTLAPWIRLFSSPASAAMFKALHPMRTSRMAFSDRLNPWMFPVSAWAGFVNGARLDAGEDNPFVAIEQSVSAAISSALEGYRRMRDAASETSFKAIYGTPGE